MRRWHGSSLESNEASVVRAGRWDVRIQGPEEARRWLSGVLSPMAIPEHDLPALEIRISDREATGTIEGRYLWRFALPKRGWLGLLLGHTVATALSLLRQFLFIHAGAVAMFGRGCVLVGPPGAGKTSAVSVLIRQGATYLSDEVALVDPAAGMIHPFPLPMAVKPWTARAIGSLPPARLIASDGPTRYFLPVRRAEAPVPVDLVVLLDPTQQAGEPVPFSRAEMLLALSEHPSSFRYGDRLPTTFAGFVDVLRRAQCLRVGSANPAGVAHSLLSQRFTSFSGVNLSR